MSNRRRDSLHKIQPRVTRTVLERARLDALHALGCTCTEVIVIEHDIAYYGSTSHTTMAHEDDCPLPHLGTTIVIIPEPDGTLN